MLMIAAIAGGGAIGAVLRYLAGKGIMGFLGAGFPYGTLAVNILGSFAMGVFVGLFANFWNPSPEVRAFLTVGLLGGFTTFSSFSLDAVTLYQRGEMAAAMLYIVSSVILSLFGLFAGLFLMRSFAQ